MIFSTMTEGQVLRLGRTATWLTVWLLLPAALGRQLVATVTGTPGGSP